MSALVVAVAARIAAGGGELTCWAAPQLLQNLLPSVICDPQLLQYGMSIRAHCETVVNKIIDKLRIFFTRIAVPSLILLDPCELSTTVWA